MVVNRAVLAGLVVLLLGCGSQTARPPARTRPEPATEAKGMTLTSPAFGNGQRIPNAHTGDGENSSPALSWDRVPDGTQSFALLCQDPDAPGKTFTHWVLYDIPAATRSLEPGIAKTESLPGGGAQAKNDFGRYGYDGPSPPPGKPHRYSFRLYALDRTLDLAPGKVDASTFDATVKVHALATAELMGTYGR